MSTITMNQATKRELRPVVVGYEPSSGMRTQQHQPTHSAKFVPKSVGRSIIYTV